MRKIRLWQDQRGCGGITPHPGGTHPHTSPPSPVGAPAIVPNAAQGPVVKQRDDHQHQHRQREEQRPLHLVGQGRPLPSHPSRNPFVNFRHQKTLKETRPWAFGNVRIVGKGAGTISSSSGRYSRGAGGRERGSLPLGGVSIRRRGTLSTKKWSQYLDDNYGNMIDIPWCKHPFWVSMVLDASANGGHHEGLPQLTAQRCWAQHGHMVPKT